MPGVPQPPSKREPNDQHLSPEAEIASAVPEEPLPQPIKLPAFNPASVPTMRSPVSSGNFYFGSGYSFQLSTEFV